MRKLVIALAFLLAATGVIGVVISPYESETVTERIVANPTGCTVDVQNYSGEKSARVAMVFHARRVTDPIDAYAFIDGCPGVPDGRPAALALEGNTSPSEACGVGLKTDHVCRVRIPAAPRRYRLLVQAGANAKPQWIEIDVLREREWRSATLDGIMSV